MAPSNKWWTLCAAWLSCAALLGSCRRPRHDWAPPEPFIFSGLCALKADPGPCKALKHRYYFSVDTRRCESFNYGGCGGNKNNFLTMEACEEACLVSAHKSPCHLPEHPGPCRALFPRYFFHSGTQQCRRFFYGGCLGNANNFKSMAECQARCQSPVNTGNPTQAPEVVILSSAQKTGDVPPTGELTVSEPVVQLADPNQEQQGDSSRPEFCLAPEDRGTCDGAERRFAFNPETKRCQVFVYSGCGGNGNNFKNRRHCVRKCLKYNHGDRMIRIRRKNLNNIEPSSP